MTSSEQIRVADEPVGTVRVVVAFDAARVTLAGAIDIALDSELDDAARAVRDCRLPVIVDATSVTFMDAAGARFIARCYGHGPLTMATSPTVRSLLHFLAMDDVLAGCDDV